MVNVVIISDKSTSYDDEETGIGKEGVEVIEEAENVSKGTKNDDETIANFHIVILQFKPLEYRFLMLNL